MSKLKQLIAHLQAKKSSQDDEVEYLVYRKSDSAIISVELSGPSTTELMRVLSKGGGTPPFRLERNADGECWLHIAAPSGKRASINLEPRGGPSDKTIVGAVIREVLGERAVTREALRQYARNHNVPRGRNTSDTIRNLRKAGLL